MKKCSTCKTNKALSKFSKNKNKRDGFNNCCKNCIRTYHKTIDGKKSHIKSSKKYYLNNKEIVLKYQGKYQKNKLINNINFRLKHRLMSRINDAIKTNRKSARTMDLLGCTVEKLKSHLESRLSEGMTWENQGLWHIDHIRPCSSFDLSNPEEQKKCFHYTNLQPLWAIDNLKKSNN